MILINVPVQVLDSHFVNIEVSSNINTLRTYTEESNKLNRRIIRFPFQIALEGSCSPPGFN